MSASAFFILIRFDSRVRSSGSHLGLTPLIPKPDISG